MNFITNLIEYVVSIIADLGYFGIIIGMLIESSFIPFPSEVVLPPAGVLVARGEMSFMIVLLSSVIGSLLGAYINYYLGLYFGRRVISKLIGKYGKFLFLKNDTLDKTDNYFKVHGSITTFTGRLLPAIRQLISIPAGFAKMPLGKFTLYTALGSGIWSIVLIYVGMLYGNNQEKVEFILGSATVWVIIFIVFLLVIYLYKRKSKSQDNFKR